MPSIRDALKQNHTCTWADNNFNAATSMKVNAQQFNILRHYKWHDYATTGFNNAIRNKLGALKAENNNVLNKAYVSGERLNEVIQNEADV